jgi:hypothetical protein
MRKLSLIGGIAAIALVPTLALAQQQTCEEQQNHRVAGTVGGAAVGALAGSAIAGRGHKTDGAILGGVVGAVIGNQATKPNQDCRHAYGYYDGNGAWHATDVEANNAAGYYDRDGRWVDGAPGGYYDRNGQWQSAGNDRGYRDRNGRYVPGGAEGYYDTDGRYVTVENRRGDGYGGQGDRNGQGDHNGQWTNGGSGGGSGGGYDNGYGGGGGRFRWTGAPGEIATRENWLDQRIRSGAADGSLSRWEADRAFRTLNDIRMQERRLARRHRGLRQSDQAYIQDKLDALSDDIRQARHN